MLGTQAVLSNWKELIALFLLGFLSFYLMKDVGLIGDEGAYLRAAISLSQYVHSDIDSSTFDRGFFSHGWFMPGMSIVLSPVTFIDLSAENLPLYSRVWMIIVNLLVVWLIMLEFQARKNSRLASWLFLVMFISPYALLYASTLWADLIACLMALYIALKSSSVTHWTVNKAIIFGVGLASIIYLRSQYVFLLPVFFFLIMFISARDPCKFKRNMGYVSFSMLLCILLILPWSIAVSEKTGIKTLTTTSLKLSQIVTFGDRNYRRQLRLEGEAKNWFYAIDNAIKKRAQRDGVTVGEQYKREHAQSLENVTSDQLLVRISESIEYYLFEPSYFPMKFAERSCRLNGALCSDGNWPEHYWIKFNTATNFLAMSLLALLMLVPIKAIEHPLLGIFLKGTVFLYMVHPLFAAGQPRYLVQFTPVLALACCLLAEGKGTLSDLIGFEKISFYGVIGNAGQLFAAVTVVVYLWLMLFY